ncbi:ATP-binding protein [Natrinema sp. 1APR25-10V2]|uniref:ATP-binding protein n=1 Tax=Natrinema sp. 1APR25-10V2 TaxID=2951081 RepID=UPI00287478A3|nr:ATP-binding protein [Natrinema sp. 1APR25-10V2]MDS0474665.1 ATP-binding protein [Natrinema sp. 1APR25-10V2]
MGSREYFSSFAEGRRIIATLGVLYLTMALTYPLLSSLPFITEQPSDVDIVIAFTTGIPGLLLLSGSYWLPHTSLRPETFSLISIWCTRGIAVMLGLIGLTALAAGLNDPIANTLMLTAIGSALGFAAGVHDARAKTRELELEETVAQLRATNDQLETANERLERFTYAASHDLQEPLRMVSSYLRLLESRYQSDLDEDAREFIAFAVNGADRMRAMVDSLHEYSRISTRGEPLEPTDTEPILEAVLDDLQPQIDETEATIITDDLPTVVGDSTQLTHVFQNLLSNALTYSGDTPPQVHVNAERNDEDDVWQFSVADEGIGIEPDHQEQIFDVFETLHATDMESDPRSSGIGLALCERIIERHGGDIWVDSTPGEGATFYFTLPAPAEEELEPTTQSLPPE